MNVRVYSATANFFDQEVDAISSLNSAGEFSILPNHAQLITLIQNTDISFYRGREVVNTLHCEKAVLHIQDNQVNIFTDLLIAH